MRRNIFGLQIPVYCQCSCWSHMFSVCFMNEIKWFPCLQSHAIRISIFACLVYYLFLLLEYKDHSMHKLKESVYYTWEGGGRIIPTISSWKLRDLIDLYLHLSGEDIFSLKFGTWKLFVYIPPLLQIKL
jgi:hypothetical protein